MMHHTILSVAKIKNFVPIWLFKIFHFELFKFIVPVRVNSCGVIADCKSAVGDDDRNDDDIVSWAVPWIFPTVQLERMRWIDVNMAGSVVYQEKKKSDKIWKQQPPRKKRRNDTEREEVLSATLEDHENPGHCSTTRDKVWLDDVVACIVSTLKEFAGDVPTRELPCTENIQQVASYVVNVSYHFCFLKQAMVNGKKCKKWSELRIELKRTLFSTLRQAKMSSGHMDSSQLLLDVVNKLLQTNRQERCRRGIGSPPWHFSRYAG